MQGLYTTCRLTDPQSINKPIEIGRVEFGLIANSP